MVIEQQYMIEAQKQKEYADVEIERLLQAQPPVPPQLEEEINLHKNEYKAFFDGIDCNKIKKERLVERLLEHKIKYNQIQEHNTFKIQAINSSLKNEITTLEVRLGPFTLQITLFNNLGKNFTHFLKGKTSTFATIYEHFTSQHQSVIKCTTFKPKDFLDTLVGVIKEYCFLKIAGVLGVGPQPTGVLGFDLVAYYDCIEFSMQKCLPLPKIEENAISILKEKLMRLHTIQVVHIDIKPENFCFSPTLKEPIFIDFGLSEVIGQHPGQSTLTYFMGSLNYCCPQMSKLYYDSTSGLIDLYYNDTVCMIRSFAQMTKEASKNQDVINFLKSHDNPIQSDSEEEFEVYPSSAWLVKIAHNFTLMKVKYFIYMGRPFSQWRNQFMDFIIKNKDHLLNFIISLPFTRYLHNICTEILSQNKKDRYQTYEFIMKFKRNFCKSNEQQNDDKIQNNNENDENENSKYHNLETVVFLRMKDLKNGLIVESIKLAKKQVLLDPNIDIFLQSPQLIIKNKLFYFQKFSQFTDLRSYSSFENKKKVTLMMLDYLNMPALKNESVIQQLGFCWNFILNYILNNFEVCMAKMIPKLFHNLYLIQFYSEKEVIETIKRIGLLQLEKMPKYETIFMCSMAILWSHNKIISRYSSSKFIYDFQQAVVDVYARYQPKYQDPTHDTITQILLYLFLECSDHDVQGTLSGDLQAMLEQVQSFFSREAYFQIKLTVISKVLSLSRTQQSNTFSILLQFMDCENKLKTKYRYNYYHITMEYYVVSQSKSSVVKQLHQRCTECFQEIGILKYTQMDTNIREAQKRFYPLEYYQQIFETINPQKIYESYAAVNSIIRTSVACWTADPKIFAYFKSKFTFDYLMNIKFNQGLHIRDRLRTIKCFMYSFDIYRLPADPLAPLIVNEQFDMIIQQLLKINSQWNTQPSDKDTIALDILSILKTCHYYKKQIKIAIDTSTAMLMCMSANIPFHIGSILQCFDNLIVFIMKCKQKEVKRANVYYLYRYWHKNHQEISIFSQRRSDFHQHFVYIFLTVLGNINQILTMEFIIMSDLQQQFNKKVSTRYLWDIYQIVNKYQSKCHYILQKLRQMNKTIIKRLERYRASSVLLCLLALDPTNDIQSSRIFKMCAVNIPHFVGNAKTLLRNIFYRYLIVINFSHKLVRNPYNLFEVTPTQFMKDLRQENNRQRRFWIRQVVRYNNRFCRRAVKVFFLIKKYKKDNKYHKCFLRLLQKYQKYSM